MPLVRIDVPDLVTPEQARALADHVHQSLVALFNVPAEDRFQLVSRRPAGEMVWPPRYLGVEHGDRVAFVQVSCSPGRTVGVKEALFARIAAGAPLAGLRPADVIVNLVETLRENWSFGEGIAHYAVQDRARPEAAPGTAA